MSAYALDGNGIVPAVSKMAFGNKLGVKLEHNLDPRDAFAPGFGSIVAEVPADKVGELSMLSQSLWLRSWLVVEITARSVLPSRNTSAE